MSGNNSESVTTRVLVVLAIIFTFAIIFLWVTLSASSGTTTTDVTTLDGVQYIDLTAKGGYFPKSITAKADKDTVLRVKTSGTFDCSSALVIPSLNYRSNLPPTGITEVKIPPQDKNSELRGTCSMGMYKFSIKFI